MANPSPGFAKNPGKVITVEPHPGTVTVTAGGVTIARSEAAKVLTEAPYPPVLYIPFADVDFLQLEKTLRTSHCPWKGDATYWRVRPAGDAGEDAMWAYETPYDEMAGIRDHAAFYPDRVTIETT